MKKTAKCIKTIKGTKEIFPITDGWLLQVFNGVSRWDGSQMLFPIKGDKGTYFNVSIYPQTIMDAVKQAALYQLKCYEVIKKIKR